MNKQEIINNILNEILQLNLITCCFTDESVFNMKHKTLNVYCVTSNERYDVFVSTQDKIIMNKSLKIHSTFNKNCYTSFYEDGSVINLYCYTNIDFQVDGKLYSLFDPNNMLSNYKQRSYAFTNIEYAKKFDDVCVLLLEYYNSCIMKDRLLAYSKTIRIQEIFIDIYRGFYDSINARRGYSNINLNMNENDIIRLERIVMLFTYDNFMNAILAVMKELTIIINSLPIHVISLLNFNFFNYVKDLIENI